MAPAPAGPAGRGPDRRRHGRGLGVGCGGGHGARGTGATDNPGRGGRRDGSGRDGRGRLEHGRRPGWGGTRDHVLDAAQNQCRVAGGRPARGRRGSRRRAVGGPAGAGSGHGCEGQGRSPTTGSDKTAARKRYALRPGYRSREGGRPGPDRGRGHKANPRRVQGPEAVRAPACLDRSGRESSVLRRLAGWRRRASGLRSIAESLDRAASQGAEGSAGQAPEHGHPDVPAGARGRAQATRGGSRGQESRSGPCPGGTRGRTNRPQHRPVSIRVAAGAPAWDRRRRR